MVWVGTVSSQMDSGAFVCWQPSLYTVHMLCKRACLLSSHPRLFISFHSSKDFSPYLLGKFPNFKLFNFQLYQWIFTNRSWLFKSWIALSTAWIAIQRISIMKTNCVIHWIVIYPVDSAIHLLNNRGRKRFCSKPNPKNFQCVAVFFVVLLCFCQQFTIQEVRYGCYNRAVSLAKNFKDLKN